MIRLNALLLLLFLLLPGPISAKINGMAITTGKISAEYKSPLIDTAIKDLKRVGTNYIHIAAYATMPNVYATTFRKNTNDNDLRSIFRKLRKNNLKIFFKPVVEINGVWRGFIKGSPKWFAKVYTPYIVQMARLAQRERVDLFSMGSEYQAAVDKTDEWVKVIKKVRAAYKGRITYVGNHDVRSPFRATFSTRFQSIH